MLKEMPLVQVQLVVASFRATVAPGTPASCD